MLSVPYCSASWLHHHQPCESTIKLCQWAHVNNVIHYLLVETTTKTYHEQLQAVMSKIRNAKNKTFSRHNITNKFQCS